MATDPEEVNGVDETAADKQKQKKASKHNSGAADLEKVTDYAEEKEITSKEITNVGGNITCKKTESLFLN